MKQVKYFCDICKKEISNSKAEMDCMSIEMNYTHNWETDLPLARKVKDIRVCKSCGEAINRYIDGMISVNKPGMEVKNDN